MTQSPPVITIDGPSGSGKGTISQLLATKLKWHFLDSGALYRVIAYQVIQNNTKLDAEGEITELAMNLAVQFKAGEIGATPRVLLENQDITDQIRSEECANIASKIATLPTVRQALIARQHAFRKAPGLVADGRDMGTVIFPDAYLKVFLSASLEERAQRRYIQLKEKGINVSLEHVLDELTERDVRDKERSTAPMKPAHDAIIIDTTGVTIEQVLLRVLDAKEHAVV